jgi:hypothetical protein
MQLAIPAAATLVILLIGDAYAGGAKASIRRSLVSAALGVCAALPTAAVPSLILICGGVTSALLVFTLRLMFPPLTHTPRSAGGPELRRDEAATPFWPVRPVPIAIAALLWVLYQFRKRK